MFQNISDVVVSNEATEVSNGHTDLFDVIRELSVSIGYIIQTRRVAIIR